MIYFTFSEIEAMELYMLISKEIKEVNVRLGVHDSCIKERALLEKREILQSILKRVNIGDKKVYKNC
ncbi:hypothetical protein [Metabacillus malikii]|uniref:Aspartyl-phosphate phosphatase Spo0E family protein n=1 Tax=Metabacillus malikii TaxID=1504265 RepID=A0ABT9ZMJ9_9BACI|nr:hypothetical protein [Metabacillus malikii]MDQ0233516.1 hypothetical protein [Metabacillus malikii]